MSRYVNDQSFLDDSILLTHVNISLLICIVCRQYNKTCNLNVSDVSLSAKSPYSTISRMIYYSISFEITFCFADISSATKAVLIGNVFPTKLVLYSGLLRCHAINYYHYQYQHLQI